MSTLIWSKYKMEFIETNNCQKNIQNKRW